MDEVMRFWACAALLGAGATAVMDLGAAALRRLAGVPAPDYGLVGRWVAWMPRGRFRHDAIARTPPAPGERPLGWLVHYAVGVGFAALLLAFAGVAWIRQPTPYPALLTGLATLAAPFLLMQPAMGAGLFAGRTPRPWLARTRSALNHALFALGLYVAGWALHFLPTLTR